MLHLHNTRLAIEKFVYKKGYNVALFNAENSKFYKAFQKDIAISIQGQIGFVADYKTHLPLLMSLAKADSGPLANQVGVLIAQKTLANDIDLQAFLVWAGTQGGQAALDKAGIYGIFGLKNQALVDYFKNSANLTIKTLDNTTKDWVAQKIQQGKDQGLTPFQIQQLLRDEGKGISKIRAERIVLTETQKAMTIIENEASRRYGIQKQIWRTSIDERVCPICAPLEGLETGVGQGYPGGYEGPPAHVSCRCYQEQVIPDDWQIPTNIWLGN
jgi:SPP1 gp7 family putative phage head morphogenesis protein